MVPGRTWVLNLDADDELARGRGFVRTQAMRAIITELATLAMPLLGPDDVLLWPLKTEASAARLLPKLGATFCATPSALAMLRDAGVEPPEAPSLEILRRVNARSFCAELGQTLPGARYCRSIEEVAAALASAEHRSITPGTRWLAKRQWGYAGRGRRILDEPARPEQLSSLAKVIEKEGGVQVEPWVRITQEFGQHGLISPKGFVTLGALTIATYSPQGAWTGSRIAAANEVSSDVLLAIAAETARAAEALIGAGYFGPFGVDAYAFIDESGRTHVNPRSEINARYSMGYAVGMRGLSSR